MLNTQDEDSKNKASTTKILKLSLYKLDPEEEE